MKKSRTSVCSFVKYIKGESACKKGEGGRGEMKGRNIRKRFVTFKV